MSSNSAWKTASLGIGTPRLLMKTQFDQRGYHVQLTDLGRVWEEVADRDAIVKYAKDSDCSFDPGADEDNYAALLKYIQSALNGEPKTTVNMQSGDSGNLELHITASLPGNLPALKWEFYLTRRPDSAVAEELVGPLLSHVNSLQIQVQQLVDEITAKDHVIQKITDKFETGGNDLTAVFPGASNVKMSRKKSQRSQLAGHVKGLADFDEATWRASLIGAESGVEITDNKLDSLLHDLSPSNAIRPPDDWWESLDGRTSSRHGPDRSKERAFGSGTAKKQDHTQKAEMTSQASMSDEEFQRQDTPPHIAGRSGTSKSGNHISPSISHGGDHDRAASIVGNGDDDETEDEDDLDGPSGHNVAHISDRLRQHEKYTISSIEKDDSTSGAASSRKLGAFGGKKATTPQPAAEEYIKAESPPSARGNRNFAHASVSPVKLRPKLGAFGGKAASKTVTPEPVPPAASSARPKSKLGAFGGKAMKQSPPPTATAEPQHTASPEPSRLGKFGGRSVTRTASPAKVKAEEEKQSTEPDERTEEQRANENRERLKRELEEKAKQPVKKKRKF
ncbi:unnamed protein product [Zymoseptoria tritici ST99CH_1E4]|uniref:Non-homologous end-joining factor 1 n=1 Tax=Zymoseptoria tritici ST99CH_1E4 TaxID=1276532 RepID=A0A2H1FJC3_ZYMTR|nr:unnamed protein product [Zymoseptoria tritici ST99CH_1E4]